MKKDRPAGLFFFVRAPPIPAAVPPIGTGCHYVNYDTARYTRGVYSRPRLNVIDTMRHTVIYRAADGWLWELWIGSRLVVVGCSETEARAQFNARMA